MSGPPVPGPERVVPERVVVDRGLLAKYDRPGPRYTSYPTAPHFTEGFDGAAYAAEIDRSNREEADRPLSLYLHIPFCDTLCWYCGCNVIVTQKHEKTIPYVDHLEREIAAVAERIASGRKVTQLHWGGGTPTYLAPEQITALIATLKAHFTFAPGVEAGVEIDPRDCTRDHLEALRVGGFNRVSMGIQDFDPQVQQAVNRVQPYEMTKGVIDDCRALGFSSINVDLIYGLPLQTVDRFSPTVDAVLALNPDRVATFNYAHVPWLKKHQVMIHEADLPSPSEKLDIFEMVADRFTAAGYVFIGMDHFARPQDDLVRAQRDGTLYRNFQGYTTHAGSDLYAFGITAISQLSRCYAQNVKKPTDYYTALDRGLLPVERGILLTDEDLLRRDVITRLMCDFRLDPAPFEARYGIDFARHFADALTAFEGFEADGLVEKQGSVWTVTPPGRLLIRNIAMPFDAYLGTTPGERFSRTV